MNITIPGIFYSKRHFFVFIIMLLLFIAISTIEITFVCIYSWSRGFTSLVIITILFEILVIYISMFFPIMYIEYKMNKHHDFEIINKYVSKSLEQNISYDMKNHLKILLLRYATIYDIGYAKKLAVQIYIPKKNIESVQLLYFKALTEYYALIGADKRFKETIDSMAMYKVPKALYNKYQLLYLLLIGDKLTDNDIEAFSFNSNLPDNCLSLFAMGLFYNLNNDNVKLQKAIKALDGILIDNSYVKVLKDISNEKKDNN